MLSRLAENQTLFIFTFVLLLWLVGYYFILKLDVPRDKKFELTIRNIAALSVFLVTYNIYLNIRSNNKIEKNRISYNTLQNIQHNWLEPQQELLNYYPEGYFLYSSMTQDEQFQVPPPEKFDAAKREQVEVYNSIRIFQAMEDFLSTGSYDITGSYVWINNFLMWMQSPILRKHWERLSFNYSDDTREFVRRIMHKGDKLILLRKIKGRLEPADYDLVSKNFPVKFR